MNAILYSVSNTTTAKTTFKCPWCDYSHLNLENSLRIHAQKTHQRPSQDLYDALFCLSGRPTCKCGCGTTPKFFGLGRGYGEWIRGHVSRVTNNWGHNEKALKNSHETCRVMRVNGELKAWNEGLTQDTSEAVKRNCDASTETIRSNPIELERRAEQMKTNWQNGVVPILKGPNHSQWKGGLSSINGLAHSLLYKAWIFPKMVTGNFCCATCGETKDLCVHHDKERFSVLLREAATQIGYDGLIHDDDFEMKSKVAQCLVDIHIERDISGIVLCRECHAQAHEDLGEASEASVIRSRAVI